MTRKSDKDDPIFFDIGTPEDEKQMLRLMRGNRKIWNYFLDLLDDRRFTDCVKSIRRNLRDKKGLAKKPEYFEKAIKNLCRAFGLDEMHWFEALESYILKNELPKESLNTSCLVLDRIEIGEDEYPDGYHQDEHDDFSPVKEPKELEPWSYAYPVIIRVNPYASQREIIDYIKKSYKRYIKPIQQKYQDEDVFMGKVRKKNPEVKARNKFIHEHRHLSRKKIMRLVNDTFSGTLEYGNIGKIVSLERKKRENK